MVFQAIFKWNKKMMKNLKIKTINNCKIKKLVIIINNNLNKLK